MSNESVSAVPNKKTEARVIRVDFDGEPGPSHYYAACPKCGASVNGVLPAALPSKKVTCRGCNATLEVAHNPAAPAT
jgi:hypothetical protein